MERRFLPKDMSAVRVEDRDDDSTKIIGRAAVYYDGTTSTEYELWTDTVERIMPGAFDRALKDGDDARALFNHDPNNLLGRVSAGTLILTSTSGHRDDTNAGGLDYEIDPGTTSVARDVVEHINRGDLQGSSFAFQVTDEKWRKEDDVNIREITGVRLFDVGPVTYPAYESTTTGVKSAGDDEARRSWDKWKKSQDELQSVLDERKNRVIFVESKIRLDQADTA